LLEAFVSTNQTRSLILYGLPGTNYMLQSLTNVLGSGDWQNGNQQTMDSSLFKPVEGLPADSPIILYRLQEVP
jgi:hypothetical protein